jgi:hypothetical protein
MKVSMYLTAGKRKTNKAWQPCCPNNVPSEMLHFQDSQLCVTGNLASKTSAHMKTDPQSIM